MLFRYSSRLLTLTRLVTRWQLHWRETEGGRKRRTRWRRQWHWGAKSERREDEEGWKKEKEELDKEGAREERRQQRKGLEERIKGREGGVNEGQFAEEGWRRRRYRIYWIKMLATKPNSHLRMILSVLHVSLQHAGDRRKDTGTHLHMGRKCHVCGHVLSSQFKSAMTVQVRLSVSLCWRWFGRGWRRNTRRFIRAPIGRGACIIAVVTGVAPKEWQVISTTKLFLSECPRSCQLWLNL